MILVRLRQLNNNLVRILRMDKSSTTKLKLKNSLTSELQEFKPIDNNNVTWYTCGPTVYSNSHMGHARNYICNDIIRRILTNHFGFNVKFGMNITDVDDKIINNSRDQGIQYFQFAKKWQADFFEDMENLGIQRPDYLTRVTQYIPEIIKFIQNVIQNGFAYESKGSVYFNIQQYKKKFKYGKLKRIVKAETQAQQTDENNQKRNKQDFALWKAAKPGQPTWDSKWGKGRPGWHIQCSAMATQIFGKKLDIHSGGIDLIFPHHQNQLAQTQAYNNEADWVKYFIHVGHLHITGCKMSKSLKNFITIKNLIQHISPRIIRLFFALHRYDVVLDYDPSASLQESQTKDKKYKNFFGRLNALIRQSSISKPQKLDQADREFDAFLEETKQKIHKQFCDNFNTPGVIEALDEAIKKTNSYLSTPSFKLTLLIKAYQALNKPFKSMGLVYSQLSSNQSKSKDIIDAVIKFRSNIRQNAKSEFKKILQICDAFRDQDMVDLQVRVQDKQIHEPSTWRFESKQILLKQRQEKLEKQRKNQEQKRKKSLQKIKKMSVNPQEMFKNDPKFTKFDQKGLPTHQKSKDGDKALKQKYRQTLQKQWNEQKKLYDKYLAQYANKQQNKQQKKQQQNVKQNVDKKQEKKTQE